MLSNDGGAAKTILKLLWKAVFGFQEKLYAPLEEY